MEVKKLNWGRVWKTFELGTQTCDTISEKEIGNYSLNRRIVKSLPQILKDVSVKTCRDIMYTTSVGTRVG